MCPQSFQKEGQYKLKLTSKLKGGIFSQLEILLTMCKDTASQQPGIPLSFPTHIDLQRLISELCPANESSAEVKCKLAVTKTEKKNTINHGVLVRY